MSKKITTKDLLKSESEVLKEIGSELEGGSADRSAGYHSSHSSGHSSSGGHNSSTAQVETPLKKTKKKK